MAKKTVGHVRTNSPNKDLAFCLKSDLQARDDMGRTLLIQALKNNEDFNLTPEDCMELARKTNLKARDSWDQTALHVILLNNTHYNLNFTPGQIRELMELSLPGDTVLAGEVLAMACKSNASGQLGLGADTFRWLLEQTEQKMVIPQEGLPLEMILIHNKAEKLGLEDKDFLKVALQSNMKAEAMTGQPLIFLVGLLCPAILPGLLDAGMPEHLLEIIHDKGGTVLEQNEQARSIFEQWKLCQKTGRKRPGPGKIAL